MKKKVLILMIAVMMTFILAGCSHDKEAVSEVAGKFMTAMVDGDFKAASEYTTEEALSSSEYAALIDMESQLYTAMGIKKKDLSEKAQKEVTQFVDDLSKALVEGYSITDVKVDGDKAQVIMDITYGFDEDAISKIDLTKDFNDLADKYMKKHTNELVELYRSKGQKAVTNKVISDLMGDILTKCKDAIISGDKKEDKVSLDLEKKDDKWLVTKTGGSVDSSES